MYGRKLKHPSAESEPKWERVIRTPEGVDKALVYPISCVMPEASTFKGNMLPSFPKKEDTYRILVIAGNLSQFAGDLGNTLLGHWIDSGAWDHIVYVPGPFEYTHATIELGDVYAKVVNDASPHISVLGTDTGMTRCLSFTGPRLMIAGAPMWPLDAHVYEDARIYEENIGNEPPAERAHTKLKAFEAVGNKCRVRPSMIKWRLFRDISNMRITFDGRAIRRDQETRIVVTYGCPSEMLSLDGKREATSPFEGTISLGNAEVYKEFEREVDHWIYGANGNKECVGKMGTVVCHRNQFDTQKGAFESLRPIFVKVKPFLTNVRIK